MKRLLVPLIFALTFPISVKAEVDPKVHKLCLPAADYAGCIKAQTSKSTDIPSLRVIQGSTELSGNSCPNGFVYSGGGICREVISKLRDMTPWRHLALLSAGYTPKPAPIPIFGGTQTLALGVSAKAVLDPNCPNKEPFIYTTSSCKPRITPLPMKEFKKFISKKATPEELRKADNELFDIFGIEELATKALNYKKPSSKQEAYSGSVKINCDSPVWKNKPRCN